MVIVFVGPAGSGKDTQALLLAQKYNFYVVSPGELLRDEQQAGTQIGKEITPIIDAGKLVSLPVLLAVISNKLQTISRSTHLAFAGALREMEQVDGIESILNSQGRQVDKVIFLDLPLDLVQQRLKGRLYSPSNGRTYHEVFNPPKNPGLDDETGEQLTRRNDDTPEVIAGRIARFTASEIQVIDYYKGQNKLVTIDALKSIPEIHSEIVKTLNLEPSY